MVGACGTSDHRRLSTGLERHVVVLGDHAIDQPRLGLIADLPAFELRLPRHRQSPQCQIEYVPVPPDPLELDPLALPDPLPDEVNDDPLDLLPDPLLEPLEDPDVDPDPDPEPEPEPESEPDAEAEPLPLVCAVASATPLVTTSAGRSL